MAVLEEVAESPVPSDFPVTEKFANLPLAIVNFDALLRGAWDDPASARDRALAPIAAYETFVWGLLCSKDSTMTPPPNMLKERTVFHAFQWAAAEGRKWIPGIAFPARGEPDPPTEDPWIAATLVAYRARNTVAHGMSSIPASWWLACFVSLLGLVQRLGMAPAGSARRLRHTLDDLVLHVARVDHPTEGRVAWLAAAPWAPELVTISGQSWIEAVSPGSDLKEWLNNQMRLRGGPSNPAVRAGLTLTRFPADRLGEAAVIEAWAADHRVPVRVAVLPPWLGSPPTEPALANPPAPGLPVDLSVIGLDRTRPRLHVEGADPAWLAAVLQAGEAALVEADPTAPASLGSRPRLWMVADGPPEAAAGHAYFERFGDAGAIEAAWVVPASFDRAWSRHKGCIVSVAKAPLNVPSVRVPARAISPMRRPLLRTLLKPNPDAVLLAWLEAALLAAGENDQALLGRFPAIPNVHEQALLATRTETEQQELQITDWAHQIARGDTTAPSPATLVTDQRHSTLKDALPFLHAALPHQRPRLEAAAAARPESCEWAVQAATGEGGTVDTIANVDLQTIVAAVANATEPPSRQERRRRLVSMCLAVERTADAKVLASMLPDRERQIVRAVADDEPVPSALDRRDVALLLGAGARGASVLARWLDAHYDWWTGPGSPEEALPWWIFVALPADPVRLAAVLSNPSPLGRAVLGLGPAVSDAAAIRPTLIPAP